MRVAIIGSGPAGFYAAEALLRRTDTVVEVDMFDRLPTPFGLVRGGVAPDHQSIKAVSRVYDKTAARPSFRFLGNVCLGRDISVEDLRQHYHQIVYAVGNEGDRRLGIPGEGIQRCIPATVFIGWYNGHPDYRQAEIDLSVSSVAVVGNGNVAIDAARILLRNPAELEKTDIAAHALEALRQSRVREVYLLGRRGPEQASFTPPELKELGEMEDVDVIVSPSELEGIEIPGDEDSSQQAKNLRILKEFSLRQPAGKSKKLYIKFLVSPVEIMAGADDNVAGLKLEKNRLEKQADGRLAAQGTGQYEHIKVEMVLPAVGFAAEPIAGVPFDDKAKIIANADGRVVDAVTRNVLANEYVVGWARTGAQGLIGSHKAASAHVAEHMVADGKDLESRLLPERNAIVEELARRGVRVVSFDDWRKLDEAETARGARRGAVRDKITDVESMLSILGQS